MTKRERAQIYRAMKHFCDDEWEDGMLILRRLVGVSGLVEEIRRDGLPTVDIREMLQQTRERKT